MDPLGLVGRHFAEPLTTTGQMGSLAPPIPTLVTSFPLVTTLLGPLSPEVREGGEERREKIANSLSNCLYIALFSETTVLPYC